MLLTSAYLHSPAGQVISGDIISLTLVKLPKVGRCNRREEACLCDWQLRLAYQDKLSCSCCSDAATNGVEEAASQGLYKACAIRRRKQQEETFRLNEKFLI